MYRAITAFTSLLFILSSLTVSSLHAQTPLDCFDGTRLNGWFSLTLEPVDIESGEFWSIAAVTRGSDARMHISGLIEDSAFCTGASPLAASYSADLPSLTEPMGMQDGVYEVFLNDTTATLTFGAAGFDAAEDFVIFVQGGTMSPGDDMSGDNHRIAFSVVPELVSTTNPLELYFFPTGDAFAAAGEEISDMITVTRGDETIARAEANTLDDTASIATIELPEGISGENGVQLTVPLDEASADETLAVNLNGISPAQFVIVVHVSQTDEAGDVAAGAEHEDDGTYTLMCDNEALFNARRVNVSDIPADTRVTALTAAGTDTVIGVFDEDDTGICVDDMEEAVTYSIDLPDLQTLNSPRHAQTVTDDNTAYILVATRQDNEAPILIMEMAEGGTAAVDLAGDDRVTAYLLGLSATANPSLALVNDAGEIITDEEDREIRCDDAGFDDVCYGTGTILQGYSVRLAQGQEVRALEQDAMLIVPENVNEDGTPYFIQATVTDDSEDDDTGSIFIITWGN